MFPRNQLILYRIFLETHRSSPRVFHELIKNRYSIFYRLKLHIDLHILYLQTNALLR